MIATFAIEMMAAFYTLWRYKLTPVSRLVTLVLVALATFQFAEYNICETAYGLNGLEWARVGFVAITTLPVLGIHLGMTIAGRVMPKTLIALYGVMTAFSVYFLTIGHGIASEVCGGNYVIFAVAKSIMPLYGLYYWGLLVVGVVLCFREANRIKDAHRAHSLRALAVGYLSFMVPTLVVITIDPATRSAIPSVMCGFAVFLAITLVAEVMPSYNEKQTWPSRLKNHFAG